LSLLFLRRHLTLLDRVFGCPGSMLPGNHCCRGLTSSLPPIEPGEIIWTGDGRKRRVVDVVPVEEDDSPFVGFLRVEPA
jgi:hypothetical protein